MALLGILHPDPLSVARMETALGPEHSFAYQNTWDSLRDACVLAPLDGCLVDPYFPTRARGLAELADLRKLRASLAIVVYADFGGREVDLFELGRIKVDGVVPAGRSENTDLIRRTVSKALTSSVAARVIEALDRRVPPLARECLRWSIENAHNAPTVREMGRPFSRSARSLSRELRSQMAPSPGRLLLWGRLFRAVHLLQDEGATVERVAYAVGYSSGAALARALRRATGHPPGGVLSRGGTACLLDGFFRETRGTTPPKRWSSASRALFAPHR